jgi:hypothetical protein
MFVDRIKEAVAAAMKARQTVAKDVLRTALGEIQTAEARDGSALTDDAAQKIVRKLVKSNEETLAVTQDAATVAKLEEENRVLTALLPRSLGVDEIVQALTPVKDAIAAAKADGPAMGVAMKQLKAEGASVESADVRAAVQQIRGG